MKITNTDGLARVAQGVGKICNSFLHSRGLYYFQFKRVYRNGSQIILANSTDFFNDILETNFADLFRSIPFQTRQFTIYSWDDLRNKTTRPPINIGGNRGVYHGITFICRRKQSYDFTTFARSERHYAPYSYYLNLLKELQKFVEIFPILARSVIKIDEGEATIESTKVLTSIQELQREKFFLPKRSIRFHIGTGIKDYITSYELFCLQLLLDGKSYKEIGSILSMSNHTVGTHLTRLKTRTGLTFQELSLQSFTPKTPKK